MTLRGAPATTFLLIALSSIELTLMLFPSLREWAYQWFAFAVLVENGQVQATLSWPILTHAALHGGRLHLGCNCAALAIFGPPVERSSGTLNYLAVFILAAAAGALTHYGWLLAMVESGFGAPAPLTVLVGASGAISGLLAMEILRRSRVLALTPAALRRMSPGAYLRSSSITFIAINLAITLLPGFISGEAHIGGFLVGLALAPILMRRVSD